MDIRWTAFPLHPETPEEGQTLEEFFAGRLDIQQIMTRLKKAAQDSGLPFGDQKMIYNSRLAQELSKWAGTKGQEGPFHQAIFQANFVQGINIGKIDELQKLAECIGLPGKEAGEILGKRAFKMAVDSDWARSRSLGIQAVPTFVLNGNSLVGAQPYEKMGKFLEAAGVKRRMGDLVDKDHLFQ